jgi:hypothetical protein
MSSVCSWLEALGRGSIGPGLSQDVLGTSQAACAAVDGVLDCAVPSAGIRIHRIG